MIDPKNFINTLKKNKINFITGVPDSLYANLCNTFDKKIKKRHIIGSNEGNSVGLAIGYYLATGKIPLVYLQNSGLGNILNPIISLADKKVFSIPIFFLIGWRGEINKKGKQINDEPQHLTQGKITLKILKLLEIKYKILDKNTNYKKVVKQLCEYSKKKSEPVAIIIRKNTFIKNAKENKKIAGNILSREQALKVVFENIPKKVPKVSTTGMLSRELNELNKIYNTENNTFMCIGGMGHAISVASGIAFSRRKKVVCLDGDGAAIMHLGSLINSSKNKNLIHILFNNNSHDSVGGQKTPSDKISFCEIATNIGYSHSYKATNKLEIKKFLKLGLKKKASFFLEIKCVKGHRNNLIRPDKKIENYKKSFMSFLKKVS